MLALLRGDAATAHMCSTEEILRSVQSGLLPPFKLDFPDMTGMPLYRSTTGVPVPLAGGSADDCQGWETLGSAASSMAWMIIDWSSGAKDSKALALPGDAAAPVASCR